MIESETSRIRDWHAHVYVDAAWALRETITTELAGMTEIGHLHKTPWGPIPYGATR